MGESLRDQLLKSGIVKHVKDDTRPPPASRGGRKGPRPQVAKGPARPRSDEEIDLARAYAIRAQAEAAERKRAEREAAERARLKRERRARVQQLLEGQALNRQDAEATHARHFEYGGKIRRVYVDDAQLAALNAGELGVVQHAGRYVLVTRELAEAVRAADADALALLVQPGASGPEDDIPADLVW